MGRFFKVFLIKNTQAKKKTFEGNGVTDNTPFFLIFNWIFKKEMSEKLFLQDGEIFIFSTWRILYRVVFLPFSSC